MRDLLIQGVTSPSGVEWINVQSGTISAWVRRRDFHANGKAGLESLGAQGIVLIGCQRVRALMDRIAGWTDFPPGDVIEAVGWNGQHFAMPDGGVFSPEGQVKPEVLFPLNEYRCSERGTLIGWKRHVAKPLVDQPVAVFCMSAAFAAPLLKLTDIVGNFGFELVGDGGTGKSLMQQLVSSTIGGGLQGDDGHYWVTFNATENALEQTLIEFADLPVILEEAALYFGESDARRRGAGFKTFAFRLGAGVQKARMGAEPSRESRFIALTSSNEPLAQLMGKDDLVAQAARDRLITIPILESERSGVFDTVPSAFQNMNKYASALKSGMREHHGKAMRRYLKKLVSERAQNEGDLRHRIGTWISEFHARADVDQNSGSAVRVANAFGLVYAAGQLARSYHALPSDYRPGHAALACYRLYLTGKTDLRPFSERLIEVLKRDDVYDLGSASIASLGGRERARGTAFLQRRGGRKTLLVPREQIWRLFPDWDQLEQRQDVRKCLVRDGRHLTVKRTIGVNGTQEHVYCFTLS